MTTSPGLAIDVGHLAEVLRASEFVVGVDQCILAERLLVHLASFGKLPETSKQLAFCLGPVFCRTPEQQATFPNLLEHFLSSTLPANPVTEEVPSSPHALQRPNHPGKRRALSREVKIVTGFAAILLLLVIVAVNIGVRHVAPPHTPTPRATAQREPTVGNVNPESPSPINYLLWTVGSLVIATGLYLCGRELIRFRFMRWATADRPSLRTIRLIFPSAGVFEDSEYRRIAHDLRRHRYAASSELDCDRTVEETARAGGYFTPVYSKRRYSPGYVGLIDRLSGEDQFARFAIETVDVLKRHDIHIDGFYFERFPIECWPTRPSGMLTLQNIFSKHYSDSALIFSDTDGLFSPMSGILRPSVRNAFIWDDVCFLVPHPLPERRVRALAESGYKVCAASKQGLMLISSADPSQVSARDVGSPYPLLLLNDPRKWTDRQPPEPAILAKLIVQLRAYLGREGFILLAGCAGYPQLKWEITLFLAEEFLDKKERNETLKAIVSLPWFRYGWMPEWLRIRLLAELPLDSRARIRDCIEQLIYGFLSSTRSAFSLDVARSRLDFWTRIGLRVLFMVRAIPQELNDYVTLSLFQSGNLGALVRSPRGIYRRLRPGPRAKSLGEYPRLRLSVIFLGIWTMAVAPLWFVVDVWFCAPVTLFWLLAGWIFILPLHRLEDRELEQGFESTE